MLVTQLQNILQIVYLKQETSVVSCVFSCRILFGLLKENGKLIVGGMSIFRRRNVRFATAKLSKNENLDCIVRRF